MPAAILIIVVGGLLAYSSFKGIGITDVLAGSLGDTLNPHGADTATAGADIGAGVTDTPLGVIPGGMSGNATPGSPVTSGTGVGPEHETLGLPGYPAHDYFAPSGSPAVSPVNGTVTKLSGHSPSEGPTMGPHGPFGWSVYIRSTSGATYYLTHMGTRNVTVGQQVQQGQVIGTVGNYAKYGTPSHIHMGINR